MLNLSRRESCVPMVFVVVFNLILSSREALSDITPVKEYFITDDDHCLGSIGPTYGDVVSYHEDAKGQWMNPTKDLDCWLHLKGIETKTGGVQRKIMINFRRFKMKGYEDASINSSSSCKTAYMELYKSSIDGRKETRYWRRCGNSIPSQVKTRSQSLLLHLVVLAPAWAKAKVNEATFIRKGSSFLNDNGTLIGPMVDFTFDFTSYFEDTCKNDGTSNDAEQYTCSNNYCIHRKLLCDDLSSANCGDGSDEKPGIPSNCSVVTTEPPPPIEEDLLPLWAVLGALAALAILFWCFWRPGFIPWRLARLRNAACCGKLLSASCSKISCCRNNGICGPRKGCFGRCCKCCESTGSEGPSGGTKPKGGTGTPTQDIGCCGMVRRRNDGNGLGFGSGKGGAAGEGWMNFACDDGAHLREQR